MSSCPFAAMLRSATAGTSKCSDDARLSTSTSSSLAVNAFHDRFMTRAISAPHLQEAVETSATGCEARAGDARDAIQPHELTPPAQSPELSAVRKMTRRELRRLERKWTLAEVRQHARKDDAWIAVDGKVYDITEHLVNHHGWHDNAAISTVLSILAHAGTDCSKEFREIHRPYPVAWRQLKAYYIGDLATGDE